MRVIVCVATWRLAGVNTFHERLVRALRRMEIEAAILVTNPAQPVPVPMPIPADIPIHFLAADEIVEIGKRQDARNRWLKKWAPTIILTCDDVLGPGDLRLMGADTRLIGVLHNDQPADFAHIFRLGAGMAAVVAVSEHIANIARRDHPEICDRMSVIPHGIPIPQEAALPPSDGPLRVVYAGRLVNSQKRALDVIAAAAAAQRDGANLHLTVAGDGPARPLMEALAGSSLRPGTYAFTGTLDLAEVMALYCRSHAVLLTSDYEGFALSLLEGMAVGCVPVATDIGAGFRAFVRDGKTGLLVAPGNIRGFAAALLRLDRDRSLLTSLSQNAVAAAGNYSLEAMATRYVALFKAVSAKQSQEVRVQARVLSRPARLLLYVEAFCALLAAHLAVRGLPFGVIARCMRKWSVEPSQALTEAREISVAQVRWALLTMVRWAPFRTKCLAHALAAKAMLRRRGIASTLYLGLRRRGLPPAEQALGRKGAIVAHAWLKANDVAVVGGTGETCSEIARYT